MTYKEALHEISTMVYRNTDDFSMRISKDCYKSIVSAIEKQIPMKPIGKHTNYKCPVCDRRVRSGKGSSSFGVDHFCQRCGQALDWSDTE